MKTSFRVVVLAFVILLVATTLSAQSTTGYLTGKVTNSDVPLAGATVTLSSPALLGSRTSTTDVNGVYFFAVLPPGDYSVRIESRGMQTVIGKTAILLSATSRFDVDLRVAPLIEAVTVDAASEPVIQTPQVATNVSASLSRALIGPSDLLGAARLAPGVTVNNRYIAISGGPQNETLAMVDGVPITGIGGALMELFVEDALQETTVLRAAIPAEYGRFTGGVVNAITRSGSNEFHGSVRDSFSNASWASERPGETITVDKVNSFLGATLGGYVLRDRLWFFTAVRDQNVDADLQTRRTNIPFEQSTHDARYEYKVTALPTENHNLVGYYLQYDKRIENAYSLSAATYDLTQLVPQRRDPIRLYSGTYNGMFSSRYFVEALYSERDAKVGVGSGGKRTSDFAFGSWGEDMSTGVMFNAPVFCSDCDVATRNAESGLLKGTWFVASPRFGSHTMVAGFDTLTEHMHDNNYQSATDFGILVNSVYRPAGSATPLLSPSGLIFPRALPNRSYISWWPILERSSTESDFNTDSLFFNDRLDLGGHFTFNVGVRYDKAHAQDANGNVTADDSLVSPRVTAVYDPRADGRRRITAAYNRYVTKVGPIPGAVMQTAGSPAAVYFYYGGPAINPAGTAPESLLDSRQAFAQMFNWLATQAGGLTQDALFRFMQTHPEAVAASDFPGYSREIEGTLSAPHVDEWVLGYGTQIGRNFYARADYVDRTWKDFYGSYILDGGERKTDPRGIVHDVAIVRNTNDATREYGGLQFQFGWTPARLNIGASYSYSTMKSNASLTAPGNQYPELTDFPQRSPVSDVSSHRGRAWVAYDVHLPRRYGTVNLAILENYDSGTPYGAIGELDVRSYALDDMDNYDYSYSGLGGTSYYFSDPAAYRLNPVTSTDLGINYSHGLARGVEFFVQGQMTNVFDEQEIVAVNKTVYTNFDDPGLALFDPRTETPVEGVHWEKDEYFGRPYGPSSYQAARTYNVSFGLQF